MLKKLTAWISIAVIVSLMPLCNPAIQSKMVVQSDQGYAYQNPYENSLTKQEGVITALIDNSISSYFIYQGEPMGFEYELLKLFANDQGLELKIEIAKDTDSILKRLAAGEADIAAANLTISEDKMKYANFTQPFMRTRQVLIQRLPENHHQIKENEIRNQIIQDPLDLDGKTIYVHPNTSFERRLRNFVKETSTQINIERIDNSISTDELIEWVSEGLIDYTVADENRARIHKHYYKNLHIETYMSLSQPLAWAVNKNANQLKQVIDKWLIQRKGTLEYNMLFSKYFKANQVPLALRNNQQYIKKGQISPYDELIKKYAHRHSIDWKLVAALINQESAFDHKAISPFGAQGLMQVLPTTASLHKVDTTKLYDPEVNINVGTLHFKKLHDLWITELSDSLQAVKFALASYNVGLGHVLDARRLANKFGYDETKWEGQVENMILRKSDPKYFNDPQVKHGYCRGSEPVHYVNNIMNKYDLYAKFTE
jgi:membrane-bound lytic murein transglycosylase F